MKLSNFLALDPTYEGKGLERGGKLEQRIWNEFSNNREELAKLANAIREASLTPGQNGWPWLALHELSKLLHTLI